ncbi:hypothetical protein BGZ52_012137 [Haplosporangium bisporale]|nr:hypothetical protein BGZ52_012137 [Haplosporangium bisporale]
MASNTVTSRLGLGSRGHTPSTSDDKVPRRATFSAATDFRPHSHCNTKTSGTCTPEACPHHAQTKSQRQFAKCFPELAELYPTSTRSVCLTPPHTPPDFSSPSTFVPSLQANLDFAHENGTKQHFQTVRRLRKYIPTSEDTLLGSDNTNTSTPTLVLDNDGIIYPDQPTSTNRSSFDGSIASTDSSGRGEGSDSLSSLTPRTSWKKDSRTWSSRERSRQRRPSADSEVDSIAYTFTKTLVAPIAIQPSSSKAPSIRSQSFKSPTPPPSLLSPSLTTTKISKSSSTVQSRGPSQGKVQIRNEIQSRILETSEEVDEEPHSDKFKGLMERSASHQGLFRNKPALFDTIASRSTVPAITTPPPEPTSPVACGCSRHYKHAILSTIVPLSVAACFEVLFSGCGTGSGDVLFKDAHRAKDGSTEFKLSAWRNDDAALLGPHQWEGKKRHMEYSVAFKVPLAKTSAACFETVEIIHYRDHAILVHSETKTPNVPYGEQFSTVHQICLTWDSPGNTRIKCFAEVNFAKKILLAGKLEAALLESSSEYYREFIRRLVEYTESLEERPMVRPAGSSASLPTSLKIPLSNSQTTIVSSLPSPTEQPNPCQSMSEQNATSEDQTANGTFTSAAPGTMEMSPALSLLSQQHLRHPPSHKSSSRASMDNLRSTGAPSPPAVDLKQRAATMDKKSALSFIQNILKTPTLPDVAPSVLKSNEPTGEKPAKDEKLSKDEKTEKDSAAVALWTDIKKISLAIFTKDPKDKVASDKDASKDTSAIDDTPEPVMDDKVKVAEVEGYNVAPVIPVKPVVVLSAVTPVKSSYQWNSLRATFALFVFVMAVSVMNMWYLFGVVSSVVQVVQEKHDVSLGSSFIGFPKFDPSMRSFQDHNSKSLMPIQTQTEMLRAEIKELLSMLEQARELGQRG